MTGRNFKKLGKDNSIMKSEREKMTNAEPFLTNDPQLMEDKKKARILKKLKNFLKN